ncbi:MAG: nucleotidyltransferase family protein, partial [Ruminococcus sp.]|nr:nucleotidyltransferase family protein [Ruminococcus sp.]
MSMITSGIVAEYNPFHNGHKYMIEQVREKGATHVVAVMSGSVVQRGDIAVFDKHFRAQKAVENGVDLVIELPFPFSCSSGEVFARSAISILSGLGDGVINNLAFGCECDDIDLLTKSANASIKLKDSQLVREKLANGLSYPASVCQTACDVYGDDVGAVLKSPNNTLAVEYIKAAGEMLPNIGFMPIKRQYVQHDSNQTFEGIASASHIRNLLCNGEDAKRFFLYSIANVPTFYLENMEHEILFRLGCGEKIDFERLSDCSSKLADKIVKVMAECPNSLNKFFALCKSKNITMSRLRRVIMHYILGAKKCDIISTPYARILAFNKRGTEILNKCGGKLPVDTSLKALENSSKEAKRIIHLENNGVRFQQACSMGQY